MNAVCNTLGKACNRKKTINGVGHILYRAIVLLLDILGERENAQFANEFAQQGDAKAGIIGGFVEPHPLWFFHPPLLSLLFARRDRVWFWPKSLQFGQVKSPSSAP